MVDFSSDYVANPTGKLNIARPVFYGFIPEEDKLKFLLKNNLGAPGIVDISNIMDKNLDWENAYTHPTQGFMGLRWNPSWIRTDSNVARWQPAGADVYRVQRKGASGAALRTLVFYTGPNSADIPNGDPVVIWSAAGDVEVSNATSFNLSGYSLPLKSKIAITACAPSAQYDAAGRREIEIDTGINLPVIDYLPPFFSGENGVQKSSLQRRHWSFYANEATKTLRLPFASYFTNSRKVIASGAAVILGGNVWAPSNYDWSKDYLNFGASLTEELFRKECAGLAAEMGDQNPALMAVELENNPVHTLANFGSTPGFKTLLNDVWYSIARQEWGQDRTLIVKSPGGVNTTLNNFDWSPPKGERAHLVANMSDAGIIGPSGAITFATIAESDWLAGALRDKITALGFSGGGTTAFSVNSPITTVEKAKKLGRVLTSFSNNNLYTWFYAHTNTDPDITLNVADVFVIDGNRIEALYPEMRGCASRAGNIFD